MVIPFISPKPRPPAPGPYRGFNCEGSGQEPAIRDGKPVCPVCGQAFRWQELINRARELPEHG